MWHYWADSPRLRVGSWANNGVLPMAKPQNMPLLNRRAVFSSTNLPQSKFFSYTKHLSNVDTPPPPRAFGLFCLHLPPPHCVSCRWILQAHFEGWPQKENNLQRDAEFTQKRAFDQNFFVNFTLGGHEALPGDPGLHLRLHLLKNHQYFEQHFRTPCPAQESGALK